MSRCRAGISGGTTVDASVVGNGEGRGVLPPGAGVSVGVDMDGGVAVGKNGVGVTLGGNSARTPKISATMSSNPPAPIASHNQGKEEVAARGWPGFPGRRGAGVLPPPGFPDAGRPGARGDFGGVDRMGIFEPPTVTMSL